MKKVYLMITSVLIVLAILSTFAVSASTVATDAKKIVLNSPTSFEFTYTTQDGSGDTDAVYCFTPSKTDLYEVCIDDFVKAGTYITVFDKDGKKVCSNKADISSDECCCTAELTANQKYYFVVSTYETPMIDTDFAKINVTEVKYPKQVDLVKAGTNVTSRYGYSRAFKADKLSDATKVDIFVPYNESVGGNSIDLFVGNSYNLYAKTTTVSVKTAGWYTLDLSDVSISDIAKDGVFYVGFITNDTGVASQFCGVTGSQSSDYYADGELWGKAASGAWYSQKATSYLSFGAVFYCDNIDIKPIKNPNSTANSEGLRVVMISDIHYNTDGVLSAPENDDTYDLERGTSGKERMQLMVDAINAEHHKRPIDFVVIVGDLRTINAQNRSTKIEDMEYLFSEYLSQLEMPYYSMRGNHDGYTNEDWTTLTGNAPQFTIETDDYSFICVDVYDYEKAPFYDSNGNNIPTFKFGNDLYYSGMAPQMDWIKQQVSIAKANGKKIWFVAHHFAHTPKSQATGAEKIDETEFLDIFQNDDSVVGLIHGHSHIPSLTKQLTVADSSVNNDAGYDIAKWNINTGNFGNIPVDGKGTTPDRYRCGFKILEMQGDELDSYHVYPAMSYPRWKTSSVFAEYDNKTFEYETGAVSVVDKVQLSEKTPEFSQKSTITVKLHTHNYITKKFTPATMTADGVNTIWCERCKDEQTTVIPSIKTISLSKSSFVFDGKSKTVSVTVTDKAGKVLTQGVDYKVSGQTSATDIGEYTVKVSFCGNYSGTGTVGYDILPNAVTDVSVVSKTNSSVVLKWNKVQGAQGYIVYKYDVINKKYTEVATFRTNTVQLSSLSSGTTYDYIVRAYKTVGTSTLVSADSKKLTVTTKPLHQPKAVVTSKGNIADIGVDKYDLNSDGVVDITDAALMQKQLAKLNDVYNNDDITIMTVTSIQAYLA